MTADSTFDGGWGLGDEDYHAVRQLIDGTDATPIVEFGSGKSTVKFGADYPERRIVSVESSPKYYRRTVDLLEGRGLENVNVVYAPVVLRRFGVRWYWSYDLTILDLPADCGLFLVDGPLEALTVRGREATLYMGWSRLAVGGFVVLHDFHRPSAKKVVRNWLSKYRDELDYMGAVGDFAVLRKREAGSGIFSARLVFDNWLSNLYIVARGVRHGRWPTEGAAD